MSDIDHRLTPLPSPRKNDRLFRDDLPDAMNNACVNFNFGNKVQSEYAYAEGYRLGARVLVEHAVGHQGDQNCLVFPIIFLYRHHIELVIKHIIRHTPYLIDRPLTVEEEKHLGSHRLDLLWQDLKPLFAGVCDAAGWDRLDGADEEGVDSYIRQLTALDPGSFSFRYTRSKKGVPSLPSDLRYINVQQFADMVERLAAYLDGLDTAVSVLNEGKMEMGFL